MRRLTKRKMSRTYLLQDGCSLCSYDERCHSIFCPNYDCVRIKDRSCPYLHVIDRLAAYEDTGLEPKEVLSAKELAEAVCSMKNDLVAVISAIKMLKEYQAIGPITHLRSLVQAERNGRLVVLPCKVGDAVFTIKEDYFDCEHCEHGSKSKYHREINKVCCDLSHGEHCPYYIEQSVAEGFTICADIDGNISISSPGEWGCEGLEQHVGADGKWYLTREAAEAALESGDG